jgi:hypothetical protein
MLKHLLYVLLLSPPQQQTVGRRKVQHPVPPTLLQNNYNKLYQKQKHAMGTGWVHIIYRKPLSVSCRSSIGPVVIGSKGTFIPGGGASKTKWFFVALWVRHCWGEGRMPIL